ncbi:hypothetical protein GCM10009616_34370 [Microlunatus lacustris]
MSSDADGVHELVDAATIHAARRDVVQAVAVLAASPLDERAADRMRAALSRAASPAVQGAVGRIGTSRATTPAKKTSLVCLPAAVNEERAASSPSAELDTPQQLRAVAGLGDVG